MTRWRQAILRTTAVGALLAGCAHQLAERPATGSADEPGLLPRSVLFAPPDRSLVQVSPDGTRISFVAPLDGAPNLWIAPINDPAAARPVTFHVDGGVAFYTWAYTGRHMLYPGSTFGDENWFFYSLDLESGALVELTARGGVQARLQALSPSHPHHALIGLNDRDPRYHDLYLVDITDGSRELVLRNDGFESFVTDRDLEVRLAGRFTTGGGYELLRRDREGQWQPFASWDLEDADTTAPIGLEASASVLFMLDSRGRDTAALTAVDMGTGGRTRLAWDRDADASEYLLDPADGRPQAVAFVRARRRWQLIDGALAEDFAVLRDLDPGELSIPSRSLDDARWIVSYTSDDRPERFYLYDRVSRSARLLFSSRPELDGVELARMQPVTIPARDGLELVSYLTLPNSCDPDGLGRPATPQPMVLLVHGGPWSRDTWGLDTTHQWLADRGYAVLSVNFRGSTGFGKAFLNAADGEWAGTMQDDLIDAVKWAVSQGIADPERIAVMGRSYGGYAALVALTSTPDVFACGVDKVGPSSLVTLLEGLPATWVPQIERLVARIGGDHRTEEGRAFLAERSPLGRADRIERPLLIVHGANDPRVRQAEAEQMVEAMEHTGVQVTYLLFLNEGHGINRAPNRLATMAVTEAFLGRCLGGRVEPFGDDLEGASFVVKAGAEHIPGL